MRKLDIISLLEECKKLPKPDKGINFSLNFIKRLPSEWYPGCGDFMNVIIARDFNNNIYIMYDKNLPIDFPELAALHEFGWTEGNILPMGSKSIVYEPEVLSIGDFHFCVSFKHKLI